MNHAARLCFGSLALAILCLSFAAEDSPALPSPDVPPAQLDAFMQKWKTYKASEGPRSDADIPLLLAALKKEPEGPWWQYLTRKATLTHAQARRADAGKRKELFRQSISYLRPTRNILADASDRDEHSQYRYAKVLRLMAEAMLESGSELGEVKGAAQELLANNTRTNSWNHGNVTYDAHVLLGQVALRQDNMDAAKRHLIAAGKTKGSPQLNSFGPRFTFAREMVEKGERDTVIEFLDLVGLFWGKAYGGFEDHGHANRKQLESWKQEIREGKVPTAASWR